jgi:hypothetical protein
MNMDGRALDIHLNNIDPKFLGTMRIPLLRGRNFMPVEVQSIIVSQSLVASAWPGQDPIGKQFDMGNAKYTVIGVAGSARTNALQDADAVEAYLPIGPADVGSVTVLVKTSGAPEALLPTVASIARAIAPEVFPEVQMMKTTFQLRMKGVEYSVVTVSVLGGTALLLACLGIIGLVTYAVSQRTQEIGIRMALGATSGHVLAVVIRQFSRPVIVGLIVGAAAAAALSQILRRYLYGISNLDPLAYVAALGLFTVVAILGALWPARLALRIDPVRALHHE